MIASSVRLVISIFTVAGFAATPARAQDVASVPSVIVLRDYEHGSPEMLAGELEQLKKIRADHSEYNCVFLEVSETANESLQNFFSGSSYAESVGTWITQSERLLGTKFLNVIPEDYLKGLATLGFKVFAADVDFSSSEGQSIWSDIQKYAPGSDPASIQKFVDAVLQRRNAIIAPHLVTHLQNHECQKAVLIIGSIHTDGEYRGAQFTPIQTVISNLGYTAEVL